MSIGAYRPLLKEDDVTRPRFSGLCPQLITKSFQPVAPRSRVLAPSPIVPSITDYSISSPPPVEIPRSRLVGHSPNLLEDHAHPASGTGKEFTKEGQCTYVVYYSRRRSDGWCTGSYRLSTSERVEAPRASSTQPTRHATA